MKWEYNTAHIEVPSGEHNPDHWVISSGLKKPIIAGFDELLNRYGKKRWEAVNIMPVDLDTALNAKKIDTTPISYIVLFKRPLKKKKSKK